MSKLYVWDANSTQQQVKRLSIKVGGSWTDVKGGYVNDNGVWKKFYPETIPTTTYSVPGTYTYTIPAGVFSANIIVAGAGGGAGGNDSPGVGHAGYGGNVVTATVSVNPGDVFTFFVGAGGGAGGSGQRGTGGALGGLDPNADNSDGGAGGNAGTSGGSGAGGGGGAATTVRLNSTTIVVAAGGGGGGGGGNKGSYNGFGQGATAYNSTPKGGAGQNKSGDGGGAGGGGGGYPFGGAGGATYGGDEGAYSGINGQTLSPLGSVVTAGTNGGASAGIAGANGYVTIAP
jgi:hypothetical protein